MFVEVIMAVGASKSAVRSAESPNRTLQMSVVYVPVWHDFRMN